MKETGRLILIPLTHGQLIKYIKCDNSLESELGLERSDRIIPAELKEALEGTILPNVADPDKNYLYSTLWTAIQKDGNKMIGELCMMGEPNEEGEVEIGYGVYGEYRNRGYMTEMLAGIVDWLKDQPGVKTVLASTEKMNIPSCRVLEKNMFCRADEKDGMVRWKLAIRDEEK